MIKSQNFTPHIIIVFVILVPTIPVKSFYDLSVLKINFTILLLFNSLSMQWIFYKIFKTGKHAKNLLFI